MGNILSFCSAERDYYNKDQSYQQEKEKIIKSLEKSKCGNIIRNKINFNNFKIQIIEGSLTSENSDCLLLIQDEKLQFKNKQAQKLLEKSGKSVKDECQELQKCWKKLKEGHFYVTHAGQLQQEYILHLIQSQFEDQFSGDVLAYIYQMVQNFLDFCFQDLALNSINIPLFSQKMNFLSQLEIDQKIKEQKGKCSKKDQNQNKYVNHRKFICILLQSIKKFTEIYQELQGKKELEILESDSDEYDDDKQDNNKILRELQNQKIQNQNQAQQIKLCQNQINQKENQQEQVQKISFLNQSSNDQNIYLQKSQEHIIQKDEMNKIQNVNLEKIQQKIQDQQVNQIINEEILLNQKKDNNSLKNQFQVFTDIHLDLKNQEEDNQNTQNLQEKQVNAKNQNELNLQIKNNHDTQENENKIQEEINENQCDPLISKKDEYFVYKENQDFLSISSKNSGQNSLNLNQINNQSQISLGDEIHSPNEINKKNNDKICKKNRCEKNNKNLKQEKTINVFFTEEEKLELENINLSQILTEEFYDVFIAQAPVNFNRSVMRNSLLAGSKISAKKNKSQNLKDHGQNYSFLVNGHNFLKRNKSSQNDNMKNNSNLNSNLAQAFSKNQRKIDENEKENQEYKQKSNRVISFDTQEAKKLNFNLNYRCNSNSNERIEDYIIDQKNKKKGSSSSFHLFLNNDDKQELSLRHSSNSDFSNKENYSEDNSFKQNFINNSDYEHYNKYFKKQKNMAYYKKNSDSSNFLNENGNSSYNSRQNSSQFISNFRPNQEKKRSKIDENNDLSDGNYSDVYQGQNEKYCKQIKNNSQLISDFERNGQLNGKNQKQLNNKQQFKKINNLSNRKKSSFQMEDVFQMSPKFFQQKSQIYQQNKQLNQSFSSSELSF